MTITSQHNQKLKEIRKLRQRRRWRERAGRFVAEGEDLLAAADAAGWRALERFCAAGSGLAGIEGDPELLASASGLGSGPRTLAVYEERWAQTPPGPLCIYLHGLHDPGNVGAVLRSAEAFGASSDALEEARIRYLGRKAELPNLLRGVAQLDPQERAATGKAANEARRALETAIEQRAQAL